jgi:sugar phosphate isomerase/epimerase
MDTPTAAPLSRRRFVQGATALAAGLALAPTAIPALRADARKLPFMISLAEWSLHRTLFGGKLDHLDFPRVAKQDYAIEAIELVNQFFKDKARDTAYLAEFKKRADGLGVKILLIMVDGEGALGDPDPARRKTAVENHHKWVEAAKYFNCHSIRVNADARGQGSFDEQLDRAADGLRQLAQFAGKHGLNVIVENHGGLSSNGAWLAGVMKKVNLPNCGTLPDFGNFRISDTEEYDRYQGVTEMMPFAKAVSAKSHDFDDQGNETHTDYLRMMKIVLAAGYRGYVGIEYEGQRLTEPEGIRATKTLLERVRKEVQWT